MLNTYKYNANKSIGWVSAGISIAVTWIWAPALFVSNSQALSNGLMGLAFFFIPNVLTILFFMKVSERVKDIEAVSFLDLIPKNLKSYYSIQFYGLQTCSLAIQLTFLAKSWTSISDMNYMMVVVGITAIVTLYSAIGGIKASVVTDVVQYGALLLIGIYLLFDNSVGIIYKEVNTMKVIFGFGIPVIIGLIAGPMGDQMFWQRVFSIKTGDHRKAFYLGAVLFAVIPLIFGVLGLSGFNLVESMSVIVFIAVFCALSSTADSNVCALQSLSHDRKWWFSYIFIILAIMIAFLEVPGLYLFLFYGLIRSTTLFPTLFIVLKGARFAREMNYFLFAGLIVGGVVYFFGTFSFYWLQSVGLIISCGLPLIGALVCRK